MDFKSIPAGLEVYSDAELSAILPALTQNPISVKDIVAWLREEGQCRKDSRGFFHGPLIDYMDSLDPSSLIYLGLDKFIGFLQEGSDNMHTNKREVALEAEQIVQVLVLEGQFTADQAASFAALGGGKPWANETVETIAAARQKAIDDDQADWDWTYIQDHFLNTPVRNKDKAAIIQGLKDATAWYEAQ